MVDLGVDSEEEVLWDRQDSQEEILEVGEVEVDAVILRILILWLVIGAGCVAIWPATVPKPDQCRREVAIQALSKGSSSNPGKKAQEERGRGRSVRFGGLNVLYDETGNEYPVDDARQLYAPLGFEPAMTEGVIEEETPKTTKN